MKIKNRIKHIIKKFRSKGYKRFDGYLRIYLTLECNLCCPYCVNQCHSKKKIKNIALIPGNKWVSAINKIGKDVIFTGGEPTLHPDFFLILSSINPEIKIKVYTNLIWTEDFIKRFINEAPKTIQLYTSYHPSGGKPEPFIDRVLELKKHHFNIMVHSINHKNQIESVQKSWELFKESEIDLIIDEDQTVLFPDACSQDQKKSVLCSKKIILISSDGYRYQCVSKMVRRKDPLENIIQDGLKSDLVVSHCNEYGYCAPCDMLGEVTIKEK